MNLFKKNSLLILILSTAFLLRVVGLYPNFLQHPDEPIVISPANKIAINVIDHLDPDPNVNVPFPFQYATAIIYTHAIIEALVLSGGYVAHNLTGTSFELSKDAYGNPNFEEFFTSIGPTAMAGILLWFHRLPSVLFGTLTVFLVYKTVMLLLKNRTIALLGALALAVMPHHVRDSHWATVNITQVFFFLLSFYFSARVWKSTSFKNCLLAGIATGFAISIKYFPLPILPLLFFLFLSRERLKPIFIPTILISICFGYILGMPYVFVYFDKMVEFYKFTVAYYSPDKAMASSLIDRFLPSYFHTFNLWFFLKEGVGPLMSFIGIAGMLYGLKQWRVVAIALLIIPVINLLFVTFYLEAIYETLMIPALPFFSIFVGIGTWWFMVNIKRIVQKKIIALVVTLGVVFVLPLLNSANASISCTKTITELEAHDWIAENIPAGATIAFQPNMRMPSKDFEFVRSDPQGKFLLSEIQESGAQYIALHSGYTDRYSQWLEDNIFLPAYTKENEFTSLAFLDFTTNARLLKDFLRPAMCVNSRIYIFRVPEKILPVNKPVKTFTFKSEDDLSGWEVGKSNNPSGTGARVEQKLLIYKFDHQSLLKQFPKGSLKPAFYGTPLRSPFIEATAGKKYTANMLIKRVTTPGKIPDGFVRLDFYDQNKNKISIHLSSRLKIENIDWENLSITGVAPKNTKYTTISIQTSIAGKDSEYLIKSAGIYH